MRTLSLLSFLFLASILFNTCSKGNKSGNFETAAEMDSAGPEVESKVAFAPPPPSPGEAKVDVAFEIKLIKTGTLEFQTSDLGNTYQRIRNAAQINAGFLSNESTANEYDRIVQHLTIRVPSRNFDKLVDAVCKGVEHFDTKTIEAVDVTEEFVDAEARLKTKKQVELRYQDLLKRANKISEILEIERQIGELRAEIESIEGRLRYLNNRVDYSTLEVSFYKKVKEKAVASDENIGDALLAGWKGLVVFVFGLATIWPILVIAAGLYFLWRRWRKK